MAHQRSAHENKFDRQMRLWGGHGQAALESSHVCVLSSCATSTECLKNLVLPNTGGFTLVDDALVSAEDLGNNFFLDAGALGTSRAQCVTRWMAEMNSDVRGTALHSNVDALIASNLTFFDAFHCVVASQLPRASLQRLAAYLYERNIPLVSLRVCGLLGLARLQVRELRVVESHPTNDRFDLYTHPTQLALWPELQRYIDSFQLLDKPPDLTPHPVDDLTPVSLDGDTVLAPVGERGEASKPKAASTASPYLNGDGLDSEEHAHIPYLVILAHVSRRWLQSHPSPPSTYDERREFKRLVAAASWDFANETNFAEAVEFAHRAYERPALDRLTAAVYADPQATVTRDSDAFWLAVAGLKRFMEREGQGFGLPVSVDIPDMHSRTEWYVQLKALFKQRSDQDTLAVIQHVHSILGELGLANDPRLATELSDAAIAHVVKHCRALRVVRTRPIGDELSDGGAESHVAQAVAGLLEEAAYEAMDAPSASGGEDWVPPNPPLIHWYLAMRAVEEWRERKGRWPGLLTEGEVEAVEKRGEREEGEEGGMDEGEAAWEGEAKEVVALLRELWTRLGLEGEPEADCAVELVRAGGCEPHVMAALMGGVGAQVALKALLRQYVPINSTLLYNGVHCSSQTWNL